METSLRGSLKAYERASQFVYRLIDLLTNFSRSKDELAYSTFDGVHVGKHLMKSIVVSV